MTARIIQPHNIDRSSMRPMRFARNRNKVTRQLFGPINHEETQAFLARELAEEHRLKTAKWNFDFEKGEPLSDSPTGYDWRKIAVTFAPLKVRKPEPEPDIGDLYAAPLPERRIEEDHEDKKELSPKNNVDGETIKQQRKTEHKQAKMTDFMAIRKRNNESISAKKATESVIPSKISKYNC